MWIYFADNGIIFSTMKQIHIYFIVGRISNGHILIPRSITKSAKNCLCFQHLHNYIVVFRLMGKRAFCTVLDSFSIYINISRIPRTVFPRIHRTVTKQAVKVLQSLMTGKILTRLILKKTMGIFHLCFPYFWCF